MTEKIREALASRSTKVIPETPQTVNGRKPQRITPKPALKTWRAFVINHPRLIFDYTDVKFFPSTQVPRTAQFIIGNQPVVILIHVSGNPDLPAAKGSISKLEYRFSLVERLRHLFRKGNQHETLTGFRFLTTEYVYSAGFSTDETENKLRFGSHTKAFVEAVGGGQIWQNPERMGPWEFGSHLSLNALKRQLTKHRHAALAKQLDTTVKWMIGGLIIAIIFAILFITQGN